MAKAGPKDSERLLDVVAGFSEFGYDLFGVVMATRFEVQLNAADLNGIFKVQAVMEDWEERASSYLVFPIIPLFQYSTFPLCSERSQLARADLDPQGLAGRGDFHFL
jgi:hypothetical protein